MKQKKFNHTARNAKDLCEILDLDSTDAIEMEFRSKLLKKIIDTVKAKRLTHAEVAQRAKASRTRVTALLNGKTTGMSTDLMLRILYSLGYKANITFSPATIAA